MTIKKREAERGVTLLELLVVLTISSMMVVIVARMFDRYSDSFARFYQQAAMVDALDVTLASMGQDLRNALPNSVRVSTAGGVTALEFLHVLDFGHYRASVSSTATGNPLAIGSSDSSFDLLGQWHQPVTVGVDRLVVANGVGGADAYSENNMVTITSVSDNTASDGSDQITFASFTFPQASSGQRFYIVDTPVTYLCDTSAKTLKRYWGYTVTVAQADIDTHAELIALADPAESALLANQVASCTFSTSTTPPLVTLVMTYDDGHSTAQVFHQIAYRFLP